MKALFLLVAAALAVAPSPVAAAAGDRPRLTAMDVFQLELASDPQVSPDGRRIVYVRQFSDVMTDRNQSNLWIVDADGRNHRALTTGPRNDVSPRWSPDGTRLAFLSSEGGATQIWVRWMDTGQMARVTNITHPPGNLAWSPDGTQIAFIAFEPATPKPIAAMPSAPSGAKWSEPPTVIDRLVYRFNGPGYLKPGFHHLFVVPAEGGTPRRLSSGDFQHGGPGFWSSDPVWMPDGRSVLLSANRRNDFELEPLDSEIWEFPLAGGAPIALTRRVGPDDDPAVSPDGRQIAYVGFDDTYQGHQSTRLHLMNRDGSGIRVLTGNLDRSVASPRWAADGGGIYFLYDDRGDTKLAHWSEGGGVRVIAGEVGGGVSAYSSGSFSVGGSGVLAWTLSRPNLPCDIATVTPARPEPRLLTGINDDLLADRVLGEVEEITYPSSRDGRVIQGWIVKPPGFDPARKYPLILEIHGGPFANYGARFDFEKQVWAAKDYVVLYTNPRGSTSYGQEFGNLIHHAYPGDDFFDLDAGVDALLGRGYIDPKNLYVTGGSGGGVLTCWMIGRTDRFRAAVSAYPVINWTSFVLTADISAFVAKYWFPALPWADPAHYEKRSLLSVVKNVKTPAMVITGEEDYRTPMSESEQYYQALKLLGVEAVLVRVPGEPHGIRRAPSHWVSKILHIVGWFDQHRAPAS